MKASSKTRQQLCTAVFKGVLLGKVSLSLMADYLAENTLSVWKIAVVVSISLLNCCRMSFILFIICLRIAPLDLMDLKLSRSSKAASALRSFLQDDQAEQ